MLWNRFGFRAFFLFKIWVVSGMRDLNSRPFRPERNALPGCANPRVDFAADVAQVSGVLPVKSLHVGTTGFEPVTPPV